VDLVVVDSEHVDSATRALLRGLWDAAFDDGFTDEDADHAYGGVHVIARDGGRVLGHASAVPRRIRVGERWWDAGYVEAVATHPQAQGSGIGTEVAQRLQDELTGRWQVGFLSTGVHDFYERLGWERWQGPSYVLTGEGLVRTPEEDDGLMVLRCGPSADLDVTAAVTCEDRRGDAW
jgi:aminoglycoside 2'-N-acetyltransferase I